LLFTRSRLFLSLYLSTQYYDSSSAFSGDCYDPATTFPRAMALSVAIVSLSYLLPLAVATGARPRADYCDGYRRPQAPVNEEFLVPVVTACS
jgi:amino acid transporter